MTDVVITGMGVVTPIGTGTRALWEAIESRRSGAGPISRFDASDLSVRIACEVGDYDQDRFMTPKERSRTDRFVHLAVAAATMACEDAGLSADSIAPDRTGVIIGSGIGGLPTIEQEHRALIEGGPRRVSPLMIPKLMPNAAAGHVAMSLGLNGPNFCISSACATGAHAIGEAGRQIAWGAADVVLAGGTEAALTPLAVAAFARMGALSSRNDDPAAASRPFDAGRDGFVFGEGAGVLVLERADVAKRRGAPILARLRGYGASADAYHVTQPDPEGKGAQAAMSMAMKEAGASPGDVHYINAHGTSTPYNDRVETRAIKTTFGYEAEGIPVSSTKSQTGHLLGAAGAVEAAVTVLSLQHQAVPPTINLDDPDPECDLDYVGDGPREHRIELALCNSFGFGGQNACLAFSRP